MPGPFDPADDVVIAETTDGYWLTDGRCAIHESVALGWARDVFPRGFYPGRFTPISARPTLSRRNAIHYRWASHGEDDKARLLEVVNAFEPVGRVVAQVDPRTGGLLTIADLGGGVALPLYCGEPDRPIYVELGMLAGLWDDWPWAVMPGPGGQAGTRRIALAHQDRSAVAIQLEGPDEAWRTVALLAAVNLTAGVPTVLA